ncbi:galactonate dehydratase [Kribbella solani]|uniref:galactonate dehydratase n=1 Tax=Kribbella solani TaxID=236067 RepID=UPI0029A63AA1|nr:galactonate dehydratase [Kribbella solani]MDX2970533.1 galactonate dehydratase [Kribbella solani]MDX3003542.1 galactonate dehydratase [Kribbella solani]
MKIVGYETFLVAPRWQFLRIDTDAGISGWGEPIVEGRAEAVQGAVAAMMENLVGADPLRTEEHWQVLAKGGFYRGGAVLSSALAGIDQALWDIKGRFHDVPVHELLGGPVRDRVRMYTWVHGADNAELVDQAQAKVAKGFTAMKLNLSEALPPIPSAAQLRAAVSRVEALRSALGDDIDIALDFHGRFSTAATRQILPLLEPLLPMFVEEPVTPEYSRDLRRITESTSIPIAVGERLFSRWDFRDVLPTGIAVAQPDISHAGGISELRRIAAMAEAYDVNVAPHCPLGPITLAASLQIDFAIPNFLIQEQSLGIEYGGGNELLDYLVDPTVFAFADGHVRRPTGPGLGIEVNEEVVRAAAAEPHRWRSPILRHDDGSFAEW